MRFDTVIHNGTIVTAADTFRADLGIRDGRIPSHPQNSNPLRPVHCKSSTIARGESSSRNRTRGLT
ncbi:hypothetical protein ACO34A_28775 (plasmid) [Rhizobium sp. ACO-34A]|nr:hypothetical protein ACO34A_28775 [Rhizobium sp. ACO-34A]